MRSNRGGGALGRGYARRLQTPGNANMAAIAQLCGLYGVRYYRMQSRVITVVGAGGVERPMFMGGWNDKCGFFHTKGMADFLLTPQIRIGPPGPEWRGRIVVPLWVEAKAGRDELSAEQLLFRDDVLDAGAYYLCCRNSCEELRDWFQDHNVVRE